MQPMPITKHVATVDVDTVICPDAGEWIIVLRDYQPWLLGFCRWAKVYQEHRGGTGSMTVTEKQGKWKWRGRRARYNDTLIAAGRISPSSAGKPTRATCPDA